MQGRLVNLRGAGQVKSESPCFPHSATRVAQRCGGAITCNLHPRAPQHFSRVCSCWRPGRATQGRQARNLCQPQPESEQWVYVRHGRLRNVPKTKGCTSRAVLELRAGRNHPGPQPAARTGAETARARAAHAPEVFGDPNPPGQGRALRHPHARGPSPSPW